MFTRARIGVAVFIRFRVVFFGHAYVSPTSLGFACVDSGALSGSTASFGFVWVHAVVRRGRWINSDSHAFHRERINIALLIRVRLGLPSVHLCCRVYSISLECAQCSPVLVGSLERV